MWNVITKNWQLKTGREKVKKFAEQIALLTSAETTRKRILATKL